MEVKGDFLFMVIFFLEILLLETHTLFAMCCTEIYKKSNIKYT